MSAWEVVSGAERCHLGEGPLWLAPQNALYWVDILAPAVHQLTLASSHIETWPMPEPIGWLIPRRNAPGFIAGFQSGFAELSLEPVSIEPIGNPEAERTDARMRMNDAKADQRGRIYAGTMDMDSRAEGALYRLDPGRTWTCVDTGYGVANGPTFSLDQRTLFHTDSKRGRVYAFDVDDAGDLHNKRVFIQFDPNWGSPDGMTTDAEGGLWIAHWGGARVSRFSPEGELERSIALPATQITSCVFAGERLERMFVTSAASDKSDEPLAGALFEIDPGCVGLPAGAFAG